ncbi:MORN repeat-containing protein [Paucibacter sp. KCTC 42545]|uniref:MORN repeat-containing protein n=1 Tax=Paucibacter sp. KCTC 42545 TaxID=1768242 RepID=UPI0012E3F265|nr:hypothetical protein [Paucibacter sp. KCTC 42545]
MSSRVVCVAGLAWLLSGGANAQSAAPMPEAAAASASAPAAPEAAASAASAATGAPSIVSCSVLTAKAMSADLRAALARSTNKDLDSQAKLLGEAIALWTQGLEGCEGRARERAQRNLADNQKQLASVAERQAAGSQCELSHQDGNALQELARQAFGERRWADAANLYAKAETMWDLAAEHCTGTQQQLAAKKREQAETDAHNAEHCAPLFDRARDSTQKFRNAAAGLNPPERQQQSQVAETLWRQAVAQCKGSAQELAGNNAQALARERGTPWVSTAPAPVAAAAATPAPKAAASVASVASAGKAVATTAAPAPASPVLSGAAAVTLAATTALTSPPSPSAPAGPAASTSKTMPAAAETAPEMDIRSGDTRYLGRFVRETGQVVSGTGRVEWSNGDVYIGPLIRSVRQGRGEFIWASGQRYVGDWLDDKPTGKGQMRFANGNQWDGPVIDGVPEGEGQLMFANGDSYKGQVSRGIPHGRGLFRWTNGQVFDGDWVNEQPQGQGVLRFANGNRYEGAVSAGQPHGKGVLVHASGDRYEGDFKQGKPHGQGSYAWKSGERFAGAWVEGLKHGQGIYYWANGDRWEGEFKNDETVDDKGTIIRKE